MLRNDDIGDRVEDELDVTCVCGTSAVSINSFPFWVLIQLYKLVTDEIHAFLESIWTWIGG